MVPYGIHIHDRGQVISIHCGISRFLFRAQTFPIQIYFDIFFSAVEILGRRYDLRVWRRWAIAGCPDAAGKFRRV
jgi:hypothetical protein